MELSFEQRNAVESDSKKILVVSAAGSGKAQPNWTRIPTPNGWTTLGEIKIGDYVFDKDGNPTKVLGIFPQGVIDCYKVVLADGRITYCNDQHIWSCFSNKGAGNNLKDFTISEMLKTGITEIKNGKSNFIFRVPFQKAVLYKEKNLPIDPYVLGCFIGDGCCREKSLTISSSDEELVKNIAKKINCSYKKLHEHNYSWSFYRNSKNINTKDFFKEFEKELVNYCNFKSVPDIYLHGSIEQRYELLRGLMDTDGSITCNGNRWHCSYTTTSEKLKNNFCELVGSLGYKYSVHEDIRENKYTKTGKCFDIRLNIANEEKEKLFSLSRKKELATKAKGFKKKTKYDRVSIVSIEKMMKKEEMTCIYVDNPQHLYLTNDFIVTHNTRVLTERAKYLLNNGINPQKLVLITYTNNAAQEMRDRLTDCAGFEKVSMSTIHSYAAQLLAMNRINIDGLLERAKIDDDFDRLFDEVRRNLNNMYIPEIDHLLIDEFQDVAPQEYKFIKTILKPHHLFAVGDPRQMIYSFKGSSKDAFDDLYNDPETKTYELTENYRSKAGILRTAQQAIKDLPEAVITEVVPMREGKAEISTISFDLEEVVDILKEDGNYKDWFVLARTNKLIAEIAATFDRYKIPYTNFRQAEKTTEEIKQLMNSNVVKLLTIHSAKGLESKNVILFENYLGSSKWSQEDRDEEKRIRYVGITRAEDKLILVKQKRRGPTRSSFGYGGGFSF